MKLIFRVSSATGVAYLHTWRLVLNSPYDILEPVGNPMPDDAWPFSPSFILAESSAIGISRLMKSYLDPHFAPYIDSVPPAPAWATRHASATSNRSGSEGMGLPNGGGLPLNAGPLDKLALSEEDYARYKRDEFRRIPPLWGLVVLRACWVHVIGMRKLRACLLTERIATDAEMLRSTLETVRSLVNDIEAALEGLEDSAWKHTAEVYRIIKSWAETDVIATDGEHGIWVGPTPEELAVIRGGA